MKEVWRGPGIATGTSTGTAKGRRLTEEVLFGDDEAANEVGCLPNDRECDGEGAGGEETDVESDPGAHELL
jgi:hypothetical protein